MVLLNSFANEPRLGKNEMFCDTGNNLTLFSRRELRRDKSKRRVVFARKVKALYLLNYTT